jgi:peptidoglycan/xylan/chitin deacetylase (PgdA/CDA1 family)
MPSWLCTRLSRYQSSLVLVCMLIVLICLAACTFTYNWAYAAAENGNRESDAAHGAFGKLSAGERVWTEKAYVKPEQPTVYLTFDDGPSKLTERVLDILQQEEIKATFFVLGEQVEAYPELLKRAVSEGHTIGNHTYNHKYSELYKGFASFWEQIERTDKILAETADIQPRLVRAPGGTFGNFDAFYFYYLDQAGYEVHDWHIDSGDARRVGVPAAEIIQTVGKGPFHDELIVLMHDGTGHEQTVKALPEIIRQFKEKGYTFAALQSSVQPVHASIGRVKWPRQVDEAAYRKQSAQAAQHKLALEAAEEGKLALPAAVAETEARLAHAASAKALAVKAPLEVILGSQSLVLDADRNRLEAGHYQVPLRELMGALAGGIEWRSDQRTAAARYGLQTLEYDFVRQELRISGPGTAATIHLPQAELRDGTVYVPLRDTLDKLGIRIASYGPQDGLMKIQAAVPGRFFARTGLLPR